MTISDYLIIATIAKFKSLTLTAEALHLTKSAISHSISKTENQLGVQIFHRTNKSVTLTTYGEALLPHVLAVLAEDKKFEEKLVQLRCSASSIVRIGSCSSIGVNWMPEVKELFLEKYPDVEIQLRTGACNAKLKEWLLHDEIDIALGAIPSHGKLHSEAIFKDEMMFISSMNFVPKNGTYITYEELKTIPLLMQESPYNDEVLAFLGTVDCNLKTMITAYDDSALVAMTEEGMGCCIQAKLFMKKLNANVKVYSFEDKPCRTIYLVKKKYAQQTGVLKKICKFLKDYASAYPTDYDLEHCYLQSYDTELA